MKHPNVRCPDLRGISGAALRGVERSFFLHLWDVDLTESWLEKISRVGRIGSSVSLPCQDVIGPADSQ